MCLSLISFYLLAREENSNIEFLRATLDGRSMLDFKLSSVVQVRTLAVLCKYVISQTQAEVD